MSGPLPVQWLTGRFPPAAPQSSLCLQCSSVSQWTCGYMAPRTHGNSPGVRKSADSNTTNSWEPAHGLRGRTGAVSGTRLSLGRHSLIVLRWTLIALGNAILSCNVQHYFTRLKLCRWFYTYPYVVFLSWCVFIAVHNISLNKCTPTYSSVLLLTGNLFGLFLGFCEANDATTIPLHTPPRTSVGYTLGLKRLGHRERPPSPYQVRALQVTVPGDAPPTQWTEPPALHPRPHCQQTFDFC